MSRTVESRRMIIHRRCPLSSNSSSTTPIMEPISSKAANIQARGGYSNAYGSWTLSASIGGIVVPRCLGSRQQAAGGPSHHTPRFNVRRYAARRRLHRIDVPPRAPCPCGGRPPSSLRRPRPAPRRGASTGRARIPSLTHPIDSNSNGHAKVESEECGRSPLDASAQVHSSPGDLTNTFRNRGFGVHSPS